MQQEDLAVAGVLGGDVIVRDEPLPTIHNLNLDLNIAELVSGKPTPKRKVATTSNDDDAVIDEQRKDGDEEEVPQEGESDEEFILPAKRNKRPKRAARKMLPLSKVILLVLGPGDGDVDAQKAKAESLGAKCLKRLGKSQTHVIWNDGGSSKQLVAAHTAGVSVVMSSWLDACQEAKQCLAVEEYLVPQQTIDQAKVQKEVNKKKRKKNVQSVPKDSEGNVVLPVVLNGNDITLLSLGTVRPQHGFFSTTTLFPVGFKTQSKRRSYVHPTVEVPYTFDITETQVDAIDSAPQFRITCPHDPDNPVVADSAAAACSIILSRLDGGAEVAPLSDEEGELWFGLSDITVRYLLQQLPGVDQCEGFVMQELKVKKRAKVSAAERLAIKNRKAREKEEKAAARALAKQKRDEEKAEKERIKQERADELAAKKAVRDAEKVAKEQEEAAKKKAKAKQQNMMASFFAKADAPPVKVKDIVAPILPNRAAPFDSESFERTLQQQSGSLTEPLAYFRAQRGHTQKTARVPREKFLKYHDDYYRPMFSVLWRGDVRQLSKVNGRKPFAQHEEIEYDYDSDEDWENWNQAEIIDDGEDLEDLEELEPMAGDEKLAEGEENFIVPDNLIIMEDDSVKRGLAVRPQGEFKHKELELVTLFHSCSSGVAPRPVQLSQLTVAPVPLALFNAFPVDVQKVTPQIVRKRKVASTPSSSKTGGAPSSSGKKRGRKSTPVDLEALKRILQQHAGSGLDKLVTAFQECAEGSGTTKSGVRQAIKSVAVKLGKTWTVKASN